MRLDRQHEARIVEEEAKLRWLIARQPNSLELHYYLVFLLVAYDRYAQARKECHRILSIYPDDVIAQAWSETLHGAPILVCRGRRSAHRRTKQGGGFWKLAHRPSH